MQTRTDKGDLQAKVIQDIVEERDYQDRKWGADRNHYNSTWLMILGEEVGEANKAALEYKFGLECEQEDKIKELRKELVQVAAVAIAFLECLDRNHR